MNSTILNALKDSLTERGVDAARLKGVSDTNRSLLVRVRDHHFKLRINEDKVIIMLRQCLNINGLFFKSPYGSAYEAVVSISLADPDCFNQIYDLLCKRWFTSEERDSGT